MLYTVCGKRAHTHACQRMYMMIHQNGQEEKHANECTSMICSSARNHVMLVKRAGTKHGAQLSRTNGQEIQHGISRTNGQESQLGISA